MISEERVGSEKVEAAYLQHFKHRVAMELGIKLDFLRYYLVSRRHSDDDGDDSRSP